MLVVQVENNDAACKQLKSNALVLAAQQIKIVQQDVFRYLMREEVQAFDLAFLDPPFGRNLVAQCCRLLEEKGWLTDNAKIYVEAERCWPLHNLPQNWRLLKSKTAGEVGFHLLERSV